VASGEEQAAAPGGAGLLRELVSRLDGARAARLRRAAEIQLAADQAAVDALLSRSEQVTLAMDELRADPRVARLLDDDLEGPGLTREEIESGMRAAMGLAAPAPGPSGVAMPPVGDLAHVIGLR